MHLRKVPALLCMTVLLTSCGDAKKPPVAVSPQPSVSVTLRAIGTQTQRGAITASVPDGQLATPQERALPWEASYSVPRGTPALVKVDNKSTGGSVRCQILIDGSVVKEAESGADVNSATCLIPRV